MANNFTPRPEYSLALPSWQLVKRCVKGAREVRLYPQYLPMPDPTDTSERNLERYAQYRKRAMFLNVTGRTKQGLLGAVFRKTAELTLPTLVEYLKENASGDGTSLEQLSKAAVGECLDTARGGFLVDYPKMEPGQTVSSVAEAAHKRAMIHMYGAEQIIDWDTDVVKGVSTLVYVNLAENVSEFDRDTLTRTTSCQNRVLLIVEGRYVHRVYDETGTIIYDEMPTDHAGRPFDHIPFSFFGAENNDSEIDRSPLEDIADVNILHYGNSATVEESGFISSQPTLFITTDLDNDTFAKFNPNGMAVGSTRGHVLGKTGSATLVQATESQLARTLMKDKEDQMLMIGARIVQAGSGAETAEAVRIRYTSDNSVLSTIAGNVSEAIKKAILDAERFMMPEPDSEGTVFWLNQAFFDETMTSQDILAQVQLWQQGFIAKKDVRINLRQGGVLEADRSDDDIEDDLQADGPGVTGGIV